VVLVRFAGLEKVREELTVEQIGEGDPPQVMKEALSQIRDYLAGSRRDFDLTLDWRGMTPFELAVRQYTRGIPFGEVRTYGQVAQAVGKSGAGIAVGGVQASNPMPLIIPCHRVLGSDGKLHGFNAPDGVKTKAWLLAHEGYLLTGSEF
jgi:methylated-DNA-[protein]-cysteine S-methyltransferase